MTEQQVAVAEPSPGARQDFLRAVVKLCRERVYEDIQPADVAKLAGHDEQQLRAIWPTKSLMVVEALFGEVAPRLVFPDTGDFEADLRSQLTSIAEAFGDPGVGPHIAALAAEANTDRMLAKVFLDRVFTPNRAAASKRFRAAQEAGQVRRDLDLDAAIDMVFGPIWFRLLLGTGTLTAELGASLADHAVGGLASRPDRTD
ncbi:hypothetical protein DMB38_08180 [Streptomyces sp. WAC 06738]|uniref:TetR-like C-terminal domain-containing protein n=1 Tax=Streptomyces sp. WAC 06738 TaxID=2203210 RepID=UPI000F6B739E|nr:TetR-like C-terminal domain-containing protein [Streptomyces sp. WAC 06738]AZM45812.1 hypothetical protein DMB38_08180 [Streptomyces sp. WAC 06738]